MSATNPESVTAVCRDASSASVAPSASLPSTATAAASSYPVVVHPHSDQLAAVSQRITDVEKEIDGTKIKIERKETARDACLKDDPLRAEYNDELKSLRGELTQLRTKEEQLRDEAKEIRAALRHQSVDQLADSVAGVRLTPHKAASSSSLGDTFRSPPKRLDGVEVGPGVDPWLLQREDLQYKLLHAGSRVLITAPPAAGKTSVIQLLMMHPKVLGTNVLHVSTLRARRLLHHAHCSTDLASTEPLSPKEVEDWWPLVLGQQEDAALAHWDYIFVDDAQLLYGASNFWTSVVKSPGRAVILFFASTAMESLMLSTPAIPAKMNWNDFRLSSEEESDLSARITARIRDHSPEAQATWLVPMVAMVRKDACGHVGLFRCLLDHLVSYFPHTAKSSPVPSDVLRYYFGAMFDSWIAPRFFQWAPPDPEHAHATVTLLRRILLGESVPVPDSHNATSGSGDSASSAAASVQLERVILRKLLRIPVLVDSGGCAQFATDLHRRFYLRQLYPSAVRPEEFVPDMDEWLLQVLRTFEPSQLRDANSGGISSGFPKEGMLQHQFWRGACLCLPPQYRIAAEVSQLVQQGRRISGEVDFWINSDLEWAVELLRQGSGKGEHIARFKQNGAYRDLQPKQWRVVDFRPHETQPRREQDYVAVIFSPTYDRATVLLGTHRTENIVLQGKYVHAANASC